MADGWDADDFTPVIPPTTVGRWDGEDVEDVPDDWAALDEEEAPPPEPEPPKPKKAEKGKKTASKKGEVVVEDDSGLTSKEKEERAKARELEMTQDLFGTSDGELFSSEEGAQDTAKRIAESIRKNKNDPYFLEFVIELFDSLTFDMDSSSVKKLGKKVSERERALYEQEKEKSQKSKKKGKPTLGAGKRTGGVLDDFGDVAGDGVAGGDHFDDDDFM